MRPQLVPSDIQVREQADVDNPLPGNALPVAVVHTREVGRNIHIHYSAVYRLAVLLRALDAYRARDTRATRITRASSNGWLESPRPAWLTVDSTIASRHDPTSLRG